MRSLYHLMHSAGGGNTRIRQSAFMLLQRLADQPATLYREHDEPDDGPVQGEEAGIGKIPRARTHSLNPTG